MTLCEEKCELIDYDYKEERAECLCKIKTFLPLVNDINFDSEEDLIKKVSVGVKKLDKKKNQETEDVIEEQ